MLCRGSRLLGLWEDFWSLPFFLTTLLSFDKSFSMGRFWRRGRIDVLREIWLGERLRM